LEAGEPEEAEAGKDHIIEVAV